MPDHLSQGGYHQSINSPSNRWARCHAESRCADHATSVGKTRCQPPPLVTIMMTSHGSPPRLVAPSATPPPPRVAFRSCRGGNNGLAVASFRSVHRRCVL